MDRKIELEKHGVTFELPDVINTRMMLRFQAGWVQAGTGPDKDLVFVKRWDLVNDLDLLQNWQCEYYPDPKASLLDQDDPRVAYMILAVLNELFVAMSTLGDISKK